jgi:hypothetical protein
MDGCGTVSCSTGERDLKIPYAYAAAYVIVTSELPAQEPEVSAQAPCASEEYVDGLPPIPDAEIQGLYATYKAEIDEFWQRNKDWSLYDAVTMWTAIESVKKHCKPKAAASDSADASPGDEPVADTAIKEIAPPAATTEPLNVVVYATANCPACKWLTKELTKAGVKHSYVIHGNNEIKKHPGQAYPHGLINGEPADYARLQTLLEK